MLGKIKTLLARAPAAAASSEKPSCPGYFPVLKAEELIATAARHDSLVKIRENNSLSADVYRQFYLAPALNLLECVQNVPAAPDGQWAHAGGFGDLTLRFTAYATRLARGYMFPPGAAPEEQAAQGVMWQAVIFWSALFWHMPLLASLEGETSGGNVWQPGLSIPDAPYRFRFCHLFPAPHDASALAALASGQLMPGEAIKWLSGNPAALLNLANSFWNGVPDMPLIKTLLGKAADMVNSPLSSPTPHGSPVDVLHHAPAQEPLISLETPLEGGAITNIGDGLPLSGVELAVSEMMTALGDNESESVHSSLDMGDMGEQAPEALGNSALNHAQGDAEMLLSLFTAEPEVEVNEEPQVEIDVITKDEIVYPLSEDIGNAFELDNASRERDTIDVEEVLPAPNIGIEQGEDTPGRQFVLWLTAGVASGEITINQHDSRVHYVAGFVYLLVPDIFFLFLKETGSDGQREQIQASFEKRQLHRVRKGERFVRAKLYDSENKNGKFRKVNGYLVKAINLKGIRPSEDSNLLFFP